MLGCDTANVAKVRAFDRDSKVASWKLFMVNVKDGLRSVVPYTVYKKRLFLQPLVSIAEQPNVPAYTRHWFANEHSPAA